MAENKQYITQNLDNGNVMISEDVLVSIIAQAVCEVENVSLSGKNWGKGIKIAILDDTVVEVTVYINASYNQSVVSAANMVQDAVTTALESMAGVRVAAVNVNVSGIDH